MQRCGQGQFIHMKFNFQAMRIGLEGHGKGRMGVDEKSYKGYDNFFLALFA